MAQESGRVPGEDVSAGASKRRSPKEIELLRQCFRSARTKVEISQDAAGRILGFHKETVGNFERGEYTPSQRHLDRYERLYDIWEGNGEPTRPEGNDHIADRPARLSSRLTVIEAQLEHLVEDAGRVLSQIQEAIRTAQRELKP